MSEEPLDLTIVGGGVLGATCGWLANRSRPHWRIAWLEQNTFGAGCTGSSGGLLLPFGATPHLRELAHCSLQLFDQAGEIFSSAVLSLNAYVLAPEDFHAQRREGYLGTHPSVCELPPELQRVIRQPAGEYAVGPWRVKRVLAKPLIDRAVTALREQGVACREGVRVSSFSTDAGLVTLGCDDGETIRTRRAIFTTGPWPAPGSVCAPRVKRVAALHLAANLLQPWSVGISFPRYQAFLIPDPTRGLWLLSFRSEEWDVSPDRPQVTPTAADLQSIAPVLDEYLPQWRSAIVGGQAFCDAYSEDGEPIVRRLTPEAPVLYVGGGSGSGMRTAFAVAENAVESLLSEERRL